MRDEEAPHGLHTPLAQAQIMLDGAQRVRVALEVDDQRGVLGQLLEQLGERRLRGVGQVGAVETELDVDRLDDRPLVAVGHEPRDPGARLFGPLRGVVRFRRGAARDIAELVHRGLDLREPTAHFLDLLALRVEQFALVVGPPGLLLDTLVLLADLRIDLGLALADRLPHEALGRAAGARQDERRDQQHNSALSHHDPPLSKGATQFNNGRARNHTER